MKNGYGIFYFKDGDKYEGNFFQMIKEKGLELTNLLMGINILGLGKIIKKMLLGNLYLKMEILIQVNLKTILEMEMEN